MHHTTPLPKARAVPMSPAHARDEAAKRAPLAPAAPMFRITGRMVSLAEVLAANADDAEFCTWARTARPGDVYSDGLHSEQCECIAGEGAPLCDCDRQPCPAARYGCGPGATMCEQNGVCQRAKLVFSLALADLAKAAQQAMARIGTADYCDADDKAIAEFNAACTPAAVLALAEALRDQFACQIAAGLATHKFDIAQSEPFATWCAEYSYEIADAMLAERARGEG